MLSHEQEFLMLSSMQIKYRKDNWLLSLIPSKYMLWVGLRFEIPTQSETIWHQMWGNNSRSLWLGNIVLKIAGCLYTNMVTYRTDINNNPYLFFWGSLTVSTPGFFFASPHANDLLEQVPSEWEEDQNENRCSQTFRQRLSMQDSSTAELISSRSLQMTTQMFSSYTHTSFRTSV